MRKVGLCVPASRSYPAIDSTWAVVGAGIYGAWTAWAATLRGLRVVILDRGDYASGTSFSSQRIIHGGLRYLQSADFGRMRTSIRERRILSRLAPHLTLPVPFVFPTSGQTVNSKLALSVALLLNDIVSYDRNHGVDETHCIPRGRTLSKGEFLELFPDLEPPGLTRGAMFHDCVCGNTERLLLPILLAAERAGAAVRSYSRVEKFLLEGDRVVGLSVRDVGSGALAEIGWNSVVNYSGRGFTSLSRLSGEGVRSTEPTLQGDGPAYTTDPPLGGRRLVVVGREQMSLVHPGDLALNLVGSISGFHLTPRLARADP